MKYVKQHFFRLAEYYLNVQLRQLPFFYHTHKHKVPKDIKIIGMVRERNEALLLEDTLNHLSGFVDGIVVFDDASTDDSVSIANNHPAVIEVIVNKRWRKKYRIWEETANRKKLYERAKLHKPEWFFYADADERFEGDIRGYLLNECPKEVSGIKVALFDAYITPHDKKPYRRGDPLLGFRKYFGPERRDILMIWRNHRGADFLVPDAREPQNIPRDELRTKFYCQHYGKSLSIEHWEETCQYYAQHFPKYSEKWKARMGKAIHSKSDFNTKLMTWREVRSHEKIS